MPNHFAAVALAGLLAGSACASARAPVSPELPSSPKPAAAPEVPRAARLDLAQVAASIDPGPIAPLRESLPERLRAPMQQRMARYADDRARLRAARKRLTELEKHRTWSFSMLVEGADAAASPDVEAEPMLIGLVEAILLTEPIAWGKDGPEADEARRILVELYDVADTAGQYGAALTEAFQTLLPGAEGKSLRESRDVFEKFFSRAEPLDRAVAARILRDGRSDDGIAAALEQLAGADERADRFERALTYREEAARRKGSATSSTEWLDLAEDYDRTLDPARGAIAALRSRGAPRSSSTTDSDLDEERARAEALGHAAQQVATVKDDAPIEERLGRARALLALGMVDQAASQLEALKREAPRDARPVVELVLAHFLQAHLRIDVDLLRAAQRAIDDAATFEHREADYHEDALGLAGAVLFQEKLLAWTKDPAGQARSLGDALADLGARARALRPFDPGRAEAVGYLAKVAREMLPLASAPDKSPLVARVSQCASESRDLLRDYPGSLDVAKIALTCAYFERDSALALAQADSPPPPGALDTAELLRDRLAMHVVLVARQHADAPAAAESALPAVGPLAAQADAAKGADHSDVAGLRGDAASLKAMWAGTGSAEAWHAAYVAYLGGLRSEGALHARVLNNLAVALYRQGQFAEAEARWTEAAGEETDDKVAALNLAASHALALGADDPTALQAPFRENAEGDDPKYQAFAWLIALEKRKPKGKQSHAAIVKWAKGAVQAAAKASTTFPRFSCGEQGFAPKQALQLSMGWSIHDETLTFPLRVSLAPRLWLVLPAPITLKEIEALR